MGRPHRTGASDLARIALDNEIELWAQGVAEMPDGAAGRDDGFAWFASGLPVAFFNQVHAVDAGARPDALERAVATVRGRGVPFLVRLRTGVDDALVPDVEALGLREDPEEAYPAMALYPITDAATADPPPGLEIRRARDIDGLSDHVEVVSAGFGLAIDIARRLIPAAELDIPGFASYAGYVDGRPVSASLGFTRDSTVGVYNVATIEGVRGRGYGGAMTRHAIADGRRDGATAAILQSSAMGRPLYESMGFREVLTFRVFVEA
jgi:GNAT superfamily N-acetyltransferase